ncbi:MAG: bifunctional DNA-formamidopyrimidine glycosylase/DNA-(apurinic or apyrimidinic site) lyase [Spongiibacteraceae bacterium]
MPELPEVETTRRGIEPHIRGQRIERVVVRQPKLRWPIPADLNELLAGRSVESVERRGKYLLVRFEHGTLLIHLGMSGSLRIIPVGQAVAKHDHVDIELSSGQALRYTDPRRFGAMLWHEGDVSAHPLLAELGPEPLTDAFDGVYLFERSRGRSAPVKAFLMDSHIVVGVGNIYANEALFSAGIRPDRAAGRVSLPRCEALAAEVKRVLARSIKQGGTTLRDFVGGDGNPGYFAQQLNVYGRGGEPCQVCGSELKEVRLAQRSTVFCRQCQK